MKVNLKSKIPFKIKRNPYNKTFLPQGIFLNIPKVKHNNVWYNCYIKFDKNTLIISSLILHHINSSSVKEHISGEFYREKISSLKKHWILFLYNNHPINRQVYRIKKWLVIRKKNFLVIGMAILISALYYLINLYSGNSLMNWIATNLFAQTFIIFLTLSGFINIFTPFTIYKEITEKDITEIALKNFEEKKKKDERNEKILRNNTF